MSCTDEIRKKVMKVKISKGTTVNFSDLLVDGTGVGIGNRGVRWKELEERNGTMA